MGADVGSVVQDGLGDLLDVGVVVLRRVCTQRLHTHHKSSKHFDSVNNNNRDDLEKTPHASGWCDHIIVAGRSLKGGEKHRA